MEVAARMVNVLIGRVTLQGVFSLKLFRFSLVHIHCFIVLSDKDETALNLKVIYYILLLFY